MYGKDSTRFKGRSQKPVTYQPLKLHIKIMTKIPDIKKVEHDLSRYFDDFGKIDDVKILRNSDLTRRIADLRICVF